MAAMGVPIAQATAKKPRRIRPPSSTAAPAAVSSPPLLRRDPLSGPLLRHLGEVGAAVLGDMRALTIALLLLTALSDPSSVEAQSVTWPAFGPERNLLRFDGFTDTLPDFIGPIDGSAELTIFTEGNHYPVLLPLVLQRFPQW